MRAERWWVLMALAVITLIVVGDLLYRDEVVAGFLIAGPLVAAARVNGRLTAGVSAYAIFGAWLGGWDDPPTVRPDHALSTLIVVGGSVFATFAAYNRTRREEALRRMTRVADVAQRAILPNVPPQLGGVAFVTRYQSATREALIGGDLYDAALTPHGLRVIIGDVRGKGVEAVRLTAVVLAHFRQAVFAAADLVTVAHMLDERVTGELGEEDFVTVVLAEFFDGGVRLVNCGHHPPWLLRADPELLTPAEPALPLGLDPHPEPQEVDLRRGDRLLFYTDGLVEARDGAGRLFRLDEAVRDALGEPALDDALDRMFRLVQQHTRGALEDDLALMLAEL